MWRHLFCVNVLLADIAHFLTNEIRLLARGFVENLGGNVLRIYVGNLSYQAAEQELRETFELHGEVEETYIVRDRDTGRSRGFAFVEMPTDEEARTAIAELNGKEVGGRTLTVNEARPRQERGPGGGGGGGASRW